MNASRSYLKDLILYIPVKVIPALTILALALYLIRALPADQYVQYSLSVSISAISVQIFSGWLTAPIVYYLPAAKNRHRFIAHTLTLSSAFSLLSAISGASLSIFFTTDVSTSILVGIMSFVISFTGIAAAINQAERKITAQIGISAITSLIFIFSIFALFIFLSPDYRLALASLSLGQISGLLLFFAKTQVLPTSFRRNRLDDEFRMTFAKIFRYGSPLALWAGSILIINSGEKFFLTPSDETALYISFKDLLIGAASLLSMPLIMTAHPLIFRAHREGGDSYKLIQHSAILLSILFGALWSSLSHFGFDILRQLTSKDFHSLGHITLFALIAIYFSAISIYYQKPLEINARTLALSVSGVFTAFIALLAFATLTPGYGPPAAAAVFLGCQILYLFIILRIGATSLTAPVLPILVFFGTILLGELLNTSIAFFVQNTASKAFLGLWITLYYVTVGSVFLRIAKSIA